jgi:hypothetical protein
MCLYIHNYVHLRDFSPGGPDIYPLFHFISSCGLADHIGLAHFCDIKISIFGRDFHSFSYYTMSSETLTYRIQIRFCQFL